MRAVRTTVVLGFIQVCFEEVGGWVTTGAVDVVVFEIIAHFHHIGRLPVEEQI